MKLYNNDCLEIMEDLPSESVQLILTDLPYAETGNKWDIKLNLEKYFEESLRIIKPDGTIALNCPMRFAVDLINACPEYYKYEWVWEKDNGSNFVMCNYQPLRTHEFILIFTKARVSYAKSTLPVKYNPQKTKGNPYKQTSNNLDRNWKGATLKNWTTENTGDRHPRSVQKFTRDKSKIHPTQKPVALLELLIKSYTDENDVVLDTCMGSGSTGVACINTNRNFIGIELDEEYFKIASQRIGENIFG